MPNLVRRRQLLTLGAAAGFATFAAPAWASALAPAAPRRATLHNLHTGDRFDEVYYEGGRYLADALAEANQVMRDWRTGETHDIDPALYDALHVLGSKLDTRAPFQIISGYRSPRTNAMLNARSKGVATKSQHMLGKAIDVRLPGVELSNLHKAALAIGAGGVGYYPSSNFVHLDTGRVRQWRGS
ncbi:MAG: YcbK family protein [Pseudomonadota bacterium]